MFETVRMEVEAMLVTARIDEVALEKTPVLGVDAPMVVLLMVPPVMVTLGLRRLVMDVEAPPRTAGPET